MGQSTPGGQYIPKLQSDVLKVRGSGDVNNPGYFIWHNDTIDFDGLQRAIDQVEVEDGWLKFYNQGTILDSVQWDYSQTIDTFRLLGNLVQISLSDEAGLKSVDLSQAYMPKSVYDPANINEQVVGLNSAQTLANKTLTLPVIGNFTNATHNHTTIATGGTLSTDNIIQGNTNLWSQWTKSGSNIYRNSNVGIGTSTPQTKLDVAGTTRTQILEITNSMVFDGLSLTDITPGTSNNTKLVTQGYVDDAVTASGGYNDEMAQDAIGNILDNDTIGDIDFIYDDATPKISATVQDDSHVHTAATISGLTTADFGSTNVSQWNNDAGYITNAQETDKIFSADSSKLLHWSDTLNTTKGIYTPYDARLNVTAASAFGTDNSVLRADGTGRGSQSSKIIIDDFGRISYTGEDYNVFVGNESGSTTVTGSENTAVGRRSLSSIQGGSYNTAVGGSALLNATSGSGNIALGTALDELVGGSWNVAAGTQALGEITDGTYNVGLGYYAGMYVNPFADNTTSDNSIYIGKTSKSFASNSQNEIVIGADAIGNGSNTITLGSTSSTDVFTSGKYNGTTAKFSSIGTGTVSKILGVTSDGTLSSAITDNSANWNAAYNDKVNSLAFTGTTTKTLTLTQQDGGTVTGTFNDMGAKVANGLSYSNDTIKLGGELTKDTTSIGTGVTYLNLYKPSVETRYVKKSPILEKYDWVRTSFTGAPTNHTKGMSAKSMVSVADFGGSTSQVFNNVEGHGLDGKYGQSEHVLWLTQDENHNILWAKNLNRLYMDASNYGVYNTITQDISATNNELSFFKQYDNGVSLKVKVPDTFTGTNTRYMPISVNGGYADAAGNITVAGDGTGTDSQNLSKSKTGNNVTVNISGGTGTTFSVADADSSVTNEMQTLTIAGTTSPTIALSGSNTATFASGLGMSLNQATGTITAAVDTAHAQILSRLRASHEYQPKGTYLTAEADGSETNEIQTLTYTPSTRLLDISLSATDVTLPLFSTTTTDAGLVPGGSGISAKYLRGDGTWQTVSGSDSQTLTVDSVGTNRGITISGGNRIHFSVGGGTGGGVNSYKLLAGKVTGRNINVTLTDYTPANYDILSVVPDETIATGDTITLSVNSGTAYKIYKCTAHTFGYGLNLLYATGRWNVISRFGEEYLVKGNNTGDQQISLDSTATKYKIGLTGSDTISFSKGGGTDSQTLSVDSTATTYGFSISNGNRIHITKGGGSMTYPAAGIALSTGSAWAGSITNNSTNWNTAYTDRFGWDGGTSGLVAATGRSSLGGTTVGQSLFTLTNPGAITFLRVNANNTVDALDAATFRTAIGAGSASMVYPGDGIALASGGAWAGSITNNSANWNTAYTDRFGWDGGTSGLVAATGRSSLGGTTVGQAVFTLTNPSAITFPRFNADNTVSALSATDFRAAIGAGTSSYTSATDEGLLGISTPSAGTVYLNSNTSGQTPVQIIQGTGMEFTVVTGSNGGSVTLATALSGSGSANRLTYWSGSGTVSSDADFTLDATNNTMSVGSGSGNGSVTSGNFILSSDRRLKERIERIPDLNWVDKIDFKTFRFKNDESKRQRFGVIAQEVEKINPELVFTDENGNKSVGYIDLLIAKVARQDEIINELLKRIEKLEDEK